MTQWLRFARARLNAGDIIACGTSVDAGGMQPGSVIAIEIEGVGSLRNRYAA